MPTLPLRVFRVRTAEEMRTYVAIAPEGATFAQGLPPEAILGTLREPFAAGEAIVPANFIRNSVFVAFLHEVIARFGPTIPALQAEAARQVTGWVWLSDARAPASQSKVLLEDLFGAFAVQAGRVSTASYRPNPQHLILSANGFFQLPTELHEWLLAEVKDRA